MEALKPETIDHYHKFGHVCFAFTNTLAWRDRPDSQELLVGYDKLVKWARIMQVVTDLTARRMLAAASSQPARARAALQDTIQQREVIYRIFLSVAHGQDISDQDLDVFNASLASALAHACVVKTDEGFGWDWAAEEDNFDQIIWPVLRSTADLLTSHERRRVGVCEGEGCGYLFFDHSRNRSRRWCDMEDCGNRAKAKRFYDRQRDPCSTCDGAGKQVEISRVRCAECRGRGVIPPEYMCKACKGAGSVTVQSETICPDCHGTGVASID